jgi:hypothetical protein
MAHIVIETSGEGANCSDRIERQIEDNRLYRETKPKCGPWTNSHELHKSLPAM